MKKLITKPVVVEKVVEKVTEERTEIVEAEGGLITLLGKRVLLFCMNFNYSGKLVGVNGTCVELEDGGIVFETGPFTDKQFKDFQKLPSKTFFVSSSCIEAFCEVSK